MGPKWQLCIIFASVLYTVSGLQVNIMVRYHQLGDLSHLSCIITPATEKILYIKWHKNVKTTSVYFYNALVPEQTGPKGPFAGRYISYYHTVKRDSVVHNLEIPDSMIEDEGSYSCSVTTKDSIEDSKAEELSLVLPPRNPVVLDNFGHSYDFGDVHKVSISSESRISRFRCRVSASKPTSSLEWESKPRDGVNIEPPTNTTKVQYGIKMNSVERILEITRHVTREIKCHATVPDPSSQDTRTETGTIQLQIEQQIRLHSLDKLWVGILASVGTLFCVFLYMTWRVLNTTSKPYTAWNTFNTLCATNAHFIYIALVAMEHLHYDDWYRMELHKRLLPIPENRTLIFHPAYPIAVSASLFIRLVVNLLAQIVQSRLLQSSIKARTDLFQGKSPGPKIVSLLLCTMFGPGAVTFFLMLYIKCKSEPNDQRYTEYAVEDSTGQSLNRAHRLSTHFHNFMLGFGSVFFLLLWHFAVDCFLDAYKGYCKRSDYGFTVGLYIFYAFVFPINFLFVIISKYVVKDSKKPYARRPSNGEEPTLLEENNNPQGSTDETTNIRLTETNANRSASAEGETKL